MRLIAIAVLALMASPALACGPGGSPTPSGHVLKPIKREVPSKAELEQRAAAEQAEEEAMRKQGYVKAYTRCGRGSHIWIKKDDSPQRPTS
jgi:hypothetical protein